MKEEKKTFPKRIKDDVIISAKEFGKMQVMFSFLGRRKGLRAKDSWEAGLGGLTGSRVLGHADTPA